MTTFRLEIVSSPERLPNADHCARFLASALNSELRPTGMSTGGDVPRLPKVAAKTATNKSPQETNVVAANQRS